MKPTIIAAGVLALRMLASGWAIPHQNAIPDAALEVTANQRENGNISKGLHVFKLVCWRNDCSLTSLSLNQCGESGSGKAAFYPKIESSSTADGSLTVTTQDGAFVLRETTQDIGGSSVVTLRIGFADPGSDGFISRVTSFSGGFVKNSALLEKVITVEYVPLQGAFKEVELDCAALLPGVVN